MCTLHNMRTRHLRRRVPLPQDVVMGMRRAPCLNPPTEFNVQMPNVRGMRYTESTSDSLNSQAQTAVHTPSQIGHAAKTESRRDFHVRTSNRNLPPVRHKSKTSGVSRRRTQHLVNAAGLWTESSRLETWRDFLAVGRNKSAKSSKAYRRLPIWQQPMPDSDNVKQKKLHKSSKETDEKVENVPQVVNWRQYAESAKENLVNNRCDWLKLKRKLRKQLDTELERVEREKPVKARLCLESLEQAVPLLAHQQEDLAQKTNFIPTETVQEDKPKWFEVLSDESKNAGLSTDEDIQAILLSLEIFHQTDFTQITDVKEKLCLLAMSMSVKEICTLPWQTAFKLMLEMVLESDQAMLSQWLLQRCIHIA